MLNHSEEISFYRGNEWEKNRINKAFAVCLLCFTLQNLYNHIVNVLGKRFWMGICDSMLVKYGAVMVGYTVVGLPVFGPGSQEYLKSVGNDPSAITRDYVRNSSMLINLSKAIGRTVISYKQVQSLAGYTALVHELKEVLDDLDADTFQRSSVRVLSKEGQEMMFGKGEYFEADKIRFEECPIVSPTKDVLVEKIKFEIMPGMNVMISGPNGCGKSSLFRILGGLWPLLGGKLYKPHQDKLFYIPQRPYLPKGTLRDQIIYPHKVGDMLRKGKGNDKVLNTHFFRSVSVLTSRYLFFRTLKLSWIVCS